MLSRISQSSRRVCAQVVVARANQQYSYSHIAAPNYVNRSAQLAVHTTSSTHSHRFLSSSSSSSTPSSSQVGGGCGNSGCGCASQSQSATGSGSGSACASNDPTSTDAAAASGGGGCGSGNCACKAKISEEIKAKESRLSSLQQSIPQLISYGEYADALQAAEEGSGLALELFGDAHPSYASTLNNLGLLHRIHLQDYEKAAEYYQKALQIYKDTVGALHSSYLTCLNNLGLTYRSLGDLVKAQEILEQVVQTHQKLVPEKEWKTSLPLAQAYMNLAGVMRDRAFYPPTPIENPHLANKSNKNDSAAATDASSPPQSQLYKLQNQSDFDAAIDLYERSLKIVQRKYGDEHPLVATAFNNLAYAYKCAAEFSKALMLYQTALGIRSRNLPPKHPDLIVSLHNLAECLRSMGQDEKALKVQEKIVQILDAHEAEDATAAASADGDKK